jgi:hypothetical protein
MMDQFKDMYGCNQKEYTSALEKGNHPEIHTSEEFDEEGIKKYQTMVDGFKNDRPLSKLQILHAISFENNTSTSIIIFFAI